MKKFTAVLLLSTAVFITPAQAELTGHFEDAKKTPTTQSELSKKISTTTPSLMGIADKHAKELSLSAKQKAAMAIWKENNGKHMKVLMLKTTALEKISTENAIKGDKKEAVLTKVDKANALRKEIATQKLECRDNLRSILDSKQWTKLVAFYDADKEKKNAKPSQGLGTN